jgi:hypothetical protein
MIIAALAMVLATTVQAQAPRRQMGGGCGQALIERFELLVPEDLDADEVAEIVYLKEEEKLARDVYTTLSLEYDVPVFANIARAEQRHMRLVDLLIVRYGVDDSAIDDTIGVFSDPGLATLYGDLVTIGQQSLEDALWVGATIEDLDLADLYVLIDTTDNLDVALIAQNLAAGSRNHLRAFTGQLDHLGVTYEAQYLEPSVVEEILASDHERGIVYDEFGDVLAECGGRRSAGLGSSHHGEGNNGGGGHGNGNGGGGSGGNGGGDCDGTGPGGSGGGGVH